MRKIAFLIVVLLYASISTITGNKRRQFEKNQKYIKELQDEIRKIGDNSEH